MQVVNLNQNNNDIVNSCATVLSSAVVQFGSEAGAMAACDRMYQATFRGLPYPTIDCEEEYEASTLKIDLAVTLYTALTGSNKPALPDDNCSEYDCQ
ncbi:MAG: hypothetical protein ACI936_000024 [Paraglaciecola sp.]|jgi:hypothetical protein